jgi:hypothetical protein
VTGKIDAVLPSQDGPIIRDYKSGSIFENYMGSARLIKEAYKDQVGLYAALYATAFGRWPFRLEIVPLFGTPEPVDLDKTASLALVVEARLALESLNSAVAEARSNSVLLQQRLATPSRENCANCPYRPVCAPYQSTRQGARYEEGWPVDVWGKVQELRVLGNSRVLIVINTGTAEARIRGLSSDKTRHPAVQKLQPGDNVAAFNLKSGGSDNAFEESRFTVIYKLSVDSAGM